MYSKYELLYLLKILDYYEPCLVKIIKYYINTYTFEDFEESKYIKDTKSLKNIICLHYKDKEKIKKDYGHIANWNVSKITNMSGLFKSKYGFNDDISRWDVSNVTDMKHMFRHVYKFNQPLYSWDVSKVTDLSYMFYATKSFNQPLDSWDVTNVIKVYAMFSQAEKFDQPLNNWNLSNVNDIKYIFYDCVRERDSDYMCNKLTSTKYDKYGNNYINVNTHDLISIHGWLFNGNTNYDFYQPETINNFRTYIFND